MKIKHDEPFEVTEAQYKVLMRDHAGDLCGREENGKYFIKVWLFTGIKQIKQVLRS